MTKYNKMPARAVRETAWRAGNVPAGKTNEGGTGYARSAELELFLRAVSGFAGEDSFYEDGAVRDDRARELARKLAVTDEGWTWLNGFLPWLRKGGFMRSMPVLLAAEAVHARLQARLTGGSRQLIAGILDRADEPGEFIGYWVSRFGRNLPKPVKRGVADGARKLYTERSMLKYDTDSKAYRFGDVIELTHARAADDRQNLLFRYAMDRHGRGEIPEELTVISANKALRKAGAGNAEVLADAAAVRKAGMTWEAAKSLAGPAADDAATWEAQINARTGYMSLLRNLRNFDQAGISGEAKAKVMGRLTDPAEVARSRQFPFRFMSAYKELESLTWGPALETALGLSTANIPELPGRTLILIDISGSMGAQLSAKSKMTNAEAAALFAFATAARNTGRVDVWAFATFSKDVTSLLPRGGSVLRATDGVRKMTGSIGYGTETNAALRAAYKGQDRVLIFTDGQSFPVGDAYLSRGYDVTTGVVPENIPCYSWNLSAYTFTGVGGNGARYELGGLNDATFRLIPLLEAGASAKWPWEE